jgi:hypothetical protein
LVPALLALVCVVPAAQALPIYIFPVTVGNHQWKDLDGKCVSSCAHAELCPCAPTRLGGFWINVP